MANKTQQREKAFNAVAKLLFSSMGGTAEPSLGGSGSFSPVPLGWRLVLALGGWSEPWPQGQPGPALRNEEFAI